MKFFKIFGFGCEHNFIPYKVTGKKVFVGKKCLKCKKLVKALKKK